VSRRDERLLRLIKENLVLRAQVRQLQAILAILTAERAASGDRYILSADPAAMREHHAGPDDLEK
jgi:hypothetical protein